MELTATKAREACGYDKNDWEYFLVWLQPHLDVLSAHFRKGITRTFAVFILRTEESKLLGDENFTTAARSLADNIKVKLWSLVEPKLKNDAYKIVAALLERQEMKPVDYKVFDWRMREAFTYQKRKMPCDAETLVMQQDQTAGVGPISAQVTRDRNDGVQLPSVNQLLHDLPPSGGWGQS
jgi:hypothetical protein